MRVGVVKVISIISFVCLLSACASNSRYVTPTAQPADLGISSTDSNLSVTLNYLITPNGSGTWLKDARWDEYVLTVRNFSDKALTVERIRLVDPRGLYIDSGVDPYQLESVSEALAEQYKDIGIAVAIDVGASAAITGAAMAAGTVGAATGALVLAPIAMVAAPIYFLSKQNNDLKDQENIRREFTRRRLTTFTLSGNATIPGSMFFPIIPNPKALVVDYRIGSEMKVLEVSLEKLTGLHVVQAAVKK